VYRDSINLSEHLARARHSTTARVCATTGRVLLWLHTHVVHGAKCMSLPRLLSGSKRHRMTPGSPGQPRSRPPFRPPGSPNSPSAVQPPQQPPNSNLHNQPGTGVENFSSEAQAGNSGTVGSPQAAGAASPPRSTGRPGSGGVTGAAGSHSPARASPRRNAAPAPPSDRFDPAQGSFYADTWVMPPRSPPRDSPAGRPSGAGGGNSRGAQSPVRVIRPDALGAPQQQFQRQRQGLPGVGGGSPSQGESHLQGPQPWPIGGAAAGPRFQSLHPHSQVAQPHGLQVRGRHVSASTFSCLWFAII
jgi:hypothetical protein